jgi:tRNA(fMet)-specific endonuclease VapC
MQRTLDTNICSYILRKRPESVIERFAALNRAELWLSVIVAAELRFGAQKLGSSQFKDTIETWLAGFEIKSWTSTAAHHYAIVRNALERQGQPIGNMDLMIAAHALAEDSVVITNNVREFHRVPGLAVEAWTL